MRQLPPAWLRGCPILLLLVTGLACGDPVYDMKFTCGPRAGSECPTDLTCPTVPLGTGGCEDLPGLLGHAPTAVDAGRPIGCSVGLAYGNPNYGDSQVTCECATFSPVAAAAWLCPI